MKDLNVRLSVSDAAALAVRVTRVALPTLVMAAAMSGCSSTGIFAELGKKILTGVFAFGGVAGAIALSVIGVKILVANATGSSYATSQGIIALLGAGAGLILMLLGPSIADALIDSLSGISTEITIPTP